MNLEDDLLAIERSLWEGDADAYRRHLDDRCLVAFTRVAGVSTRDEVAGMVEGGPRWRELELEPVALLQPADGVAFLSYRARAERDGQRHRALVGSGYVRRGGEWKLAFHQQTPLEE
ncbi:MAG TPA: nuclear transport factor 2 family protein [Thermoanaerobaculia bacterium]|nr:nuclear transport factor 2 family protein [Thermoanaerobaculia bacterium]